MSVAFMTSVFARADLDPHEKLVMLALADHANDEGECFPSVGRLRLRTSMLERGVQGVIRRLEARGFIVTKANGGRRGSNHFTLHLPAQDGDPTPAPGAPEPSFNHQEPCARAKARGRVRAVKTAFFNGLDEENGAWSNGEGRENGEILHDPGGERCPPA